MRIRDRVCEYIATRRGLSRRLRRAFIHLISPTFLSDHDFEIDFFGFRYRGNTGNLLDRKVLFSGCHECDVIAFLRDLLLQDKNSVLLDIGANVGHHSLFLSRYARHIFAFEPFAPVRQLLDEKLHMNHVKNVTVVPVALGASDEVRPFFEPPDANAAIGSFVQEFSDVNIEGEKLEVKPADELFTELGIARADVVKIDVEGFEPQVLLGARQALQQLQPVVLFENSVYLEGGLRTLDEVAEVFPEGYQFYRFTHTGKRRHGRYQLVPLLTSMFIGKRQLAIVAVPADRQIPLAANASLHRY